MNVRARRGNPRTGRIATAHALSRGLARDRRAGFRSLRRASRSLAWKRLLENWWLHRSAANVYRVSSASLALGSSSILNRGEEKLRTRL